MANAVFAENLQSAQVEVSSEPFFGSAFADLAWLLLATVLGFSIVARRHSLESGQVIGEATVEVSIGSETAAPTTNAPDNSVSCIDVRNIVGA